MWHYIYLRPRWGIIKSLRQRDIILYPSDCDAEVQVARHMLALAIIITA